jgi:hypothetical protein
LTARACAVPGLSKAAEDKELERMGMTRESALVMKEVRARGCACREAKWGVCGCCGRCPTETHQPRLLRPVFVTRGAVAASSS